MATDEFLKKSSFAVHAAAFGLLVGCFFLFPCALTSGGWSFLRGCLGEGGFSSTIFIFFIHFLESFER